MLQSTKQVKQVFEMFGIKKKRDDILIHLLCSSVRPFRASEVHSDNFLLSFPL
jgi:hypothetical protein